MQEPLLFALILANQRIDDAEHHFVAQRFKGINLGHRRRHLPGFALEARRVIHAAHGETVQVATNAGGIMVQQRRELNDLRHAPRN